VNSRISIRPAVKEDLEAIIRLRSESILSSSQGSWSREQLLQWAGVVRNERALTRILDGCVLVATSGTEIIATNGLDLDETEMVGLFVGPSFQGRSIGSRMVQEVERLAISFGISELRVESALPAVGFYEKCHYRPRPGAVMAPDPRTHLDSLSMSRSFPNRQTRYGAHIRKILDKTGIPTDYGRAHRLKLQEESSQLATIGTDIHGREQMLHPDSAMAWYAMRNAAEAEGVTLEIASAFRSVSYQVSIIERKQQAGQSMKEILNVSAAPGFSEHHTGHAIDISCPDSPPLEQSFENTQAFEWLTESAGEFGFCLSYPRNNRHAIAYEPWHWYHHI
jgi:D-alanyl-D-alanine carboxypeptidase